MLYIKLLRPLGDGGKRGGGVSRISSGECLPGQVNIKIVVALGVWSNVGTSVWLGHQYHLFIPYSSQQSQE